MVKKLEPFDVAVDELITRDIGKKNKDYLGKLVEKVNELVEEINKKEEKDEHINTETVNMAA